MFNSPDSSQEKFKLDVSRYARIHANILILRCCLKKLILDQDVKELKDDKVNEMLKSINDCINVLLEAFIKAMWGHRYDADSISYLYYSQEVLKNMPEEIKEKCLGNDADKFVI